MGKTLIKRIAHLQPFLHTRVQIIVVRLKIISIQISVVPSVRQCHTDAAPRPSTPYITPQSRHHHVSLTPPWRQPHAIKTTNHRTLTPPTTSNHRALYASSPRQKTVHSTRSTSFEARCRLYLQTRTLSPTKMPSSAKKLVSNATWKVANTSFRVTSCPSIPQPITIDPSAMTTNPWSLKARENEPALSNPPSATNERKATHNHNHTQPRRHHHHQRPPH